VRSSTAVCIKHLTLRLYLNPLQVALVTSNIEITAADGNITRGIGGEAFGCHMIVDGPAYASLSHVSFRWGLLTIIC
jgi:hypothetical protein